MIIKSYEINKIKNKKFSFFLFYGKNQGLKAEAINELLKDEVSILKYDENEILEKSSEFYDSLLSKSLFGEKKNIIIKRATDKIIKLLIEIIERNLEDILIVIEANVLEKKSKLRTLFEKDKKCVCIPFYEDNEQTLYKFAVNFFKNKKISISPININLIVNKSNNDRQNLLNELNKIEYYTKNGKKISELAITNYNVISSNNFFSFVELKPITGRKHQLRKQLSFMGNPIVGDVKYNIIKSKNKDQKKLMLHSYKIKFLINNKKFNFKAKLPDYFDDYLNKKRLII